jgi:hypothetical protein
VSVASSTQRVRPRERATNLGDGHLQRNSEGDEESRVVAIRHVLLDEDLDRVERDEDVEAKGEADVKRSEEAGRSFGRLQTGLDIGGRDDWFCGVLDLDVLLVVLAPDEVEHLVGELRKVGELSATGNDEAIETRRAAAYRLRIRNQRCNVVGPYDQREVLPTERRVLMPLARSQVLERVDDLDREIFIERDALLRVVAVAKAGVSLEPGRKQRRRGGGVRAQRETYRDERMLRTTCDDTMTAASALMMAIPSSRREAPSTDSGGGYAAYVDRPAFPTEARTETMPQPAFGNHPLVSHWRLQ